MIVLGIRSDNPEAELCLYQDGQKVSEYKWQAGRQLAETLHTRIKQLLSDAKLELEDIDGIAVYQGPGSFTGLRIGITVANTLGYALNIPVAGATEDSWMESAVRSLESGKGAKTVMPEYGAPVHITLPKK